MNRGHSFFGVVPVIDSQEVIAEKSQAIRTPVFVVREKSPAIRITAFLVVEWLRRGLRQYAHQCSWFAGSLRPYA